MDPFALKAEQNENFALNINNDSSGCEKQYLRSLRGVFAITGYRAKFLHKNYARLPLPSIHRHLYRKTILKPCPEHK